jgi:hypothetical protein
VTTELTLHNEPDEIVSEVTHKYEDDVVDDQQHDALLGTHPPPRELPIIKTDGGGVLRLRDFNNFASF